MKIHFLFIIILLRAGLVFSGDLLVDQKGVPPVIGIAQVTSPDAHTTSELPGISLRIPKIHWFVVGEAIPKKQWPQLKAETKMEALRIQLDGPSALSPSVVVDLSGNEVKYEEWTRLLEKETPVFVSVTGEMPDPYFFQLAKPDSLVIILGPRDGSPTTQFFPKERIGLSDH
jgi:hypothetical protein